MSDLAAILTVSILLLGCSDALLCQAQPTEPTGVPPQDEAASRGESLFSGTARLQNGGPACASCHNIAGLPFPYGGSLGPDLTRIYSKLGPLGIDPTLRTLYFPAMTSIYASHPLTDDERADLKAFLQEAESGQPSTSATPVIALVALTGFVALLALTCYLWRDRLTGVRRRLLQRATRAGVART